MDPKTQWREAVLEKRRTLDPQFVQEASHKVADHLFGLEEFNLAWRIGLYSAFKNEVATDSIFQKSHGLRKEIYYPAVDTKKEKARLYRVNALQELQPGFAGILEPSKTKNPLSDLNYLNVMILPGVVFDKKGNRIGLGQGYYDRLLESFNGKKIALPYEFQVVDALPTEEKDQRVDIIVTEERIIRII